jgi:hypothetical protein
MEFNTDPNLDGPSGFEYSNGFELTGGTGEWTQYELSGHSIGDADSLPCTAYDCARKCSQKYYTSALDGDDDAAAEKIWEQMDDCIAKCPGVVMSDNGDDTEDGSDSEDDTAEAEATTSGSAVSTSTASATSGKSASEATATSASSTTT